VQAEYLRYLWESPPAKAMSYFCNTHTHTHTHTDTHTHTHTQDEWDAELTVVHLMLGCVVFKRISARARATDTNVHVHARCDTQLPANQKSQNASPGDQAADLSSSAEFICQLEIAHAAHTHTRTHTHTN